MGLKRALLIFSSALLGAGLVTTGTVVPSAVNRSAQASDSTNASALRSAAIQRDVAASWNYECPSGAQCLQAWSTTPNITATFSFKTQQATAAYGAIMKWSDFQLDYLTNKQDDYKKIVWSKDIYDHYYLPPHDQAGSALDQWKAIYASLNPLVQEAYRTQVQPQVDKLLADNLSYTLTYDASLSAPITVGTNTDLNIAAKIEEQLARDVLLQQTALQKKTLDNLLAGLPMPDITAVFSAALKTAFGQITPFFRQAFTDFYNETQLSMQTAALVRARLADPVSRMAAGQELVSLAGLQQSLLDKIEPANLARLRPFLANKWSVDQFANALADANLQNRLAGVSFSPPQVSGATVLAQALKDFVAAASKLDAISKTYSYVPTGAADAKELSSYGPGAVSQILWAASQTTNFDDASNNLNPTLSQFILQKSLLTGSGLFIAGDIDAYQLTATERLLNGLPVWTAFSDLLTKAVSKDRWSGELNQIVADLQNSKQDANAVVLAIRAVNNILYPPVIPSKAAFGTLLAFGSLVGLVFAASGYALIRGFVVKRRYGPSFWEYGRSRMVLSAIVAVSAIVASVLIGLAASGVV